MILPIIVYDRLYIPITDEDEDFYMSLHHQLTYKNPDYIKLQQINKWVGETPKFIKNYENVDLPQYGKCLSIPRGAISKLRKVAENNDIKLSFIDKRISLHPINNYENNVVLWPEQEKLANIMYKKQNCLIRSPTASGKCLHPDTKIIEYNGHFTKAKYVKKGDILMGPDSKPRKVLSTIRGYGPMYKITPIKGTPFICNDAHILTLINTESNKIIDIPIHEYLEKTNWFKHLHKLYSVGVEFNECFQYKLPVDPYFLGIWLGDGRKSLSSIEISKPDQEIYDAMKETANKWNLCVKTYQQTIKKCPQHRIVSTKRRFKNELLFTMRYMMQFGICIPYKYKIASRQNRLELLAGLLDTDGHYHCGYFEIVQKNYSLSKDIVFLARSLGFKTTIKEKIVNDTIYYRMSILGHVNKIPTRIKRKQATPRKMNKDVLRTGFKIEYLGLGDYNGWTLDGDGRFLIEDFMVTHNTELSLKLTEWLLNDAGPVLIIVWETGLLDQWVDKISTRFGIRHDEVGIISGKKKRLKSITVAMQQTLKNSIDKYKNCFGAVIVDEVQRFAAKTFREVIDKFPAKYRIGISADESRKDKKEFLIYDSFGDVAGEIEKIVLIRKNKIIEPIIRIVPTTYNHIQRYGSAESYIEVQWQNLPADQKDYNILLDNLTECEDRNDFIWQFIEPALKVGKITIVASTRVDNTIYWDNRICKAGYETGLMLGGLKRADEYKKTVSGLQQRKIQVGVGTVQKIGVGLDITPLERLFIVTPLAANRQKFDQAVGRMRRTSKGKEDAVVYYFWDKKLFPAHKTNLQKYYKGYSQIYTDNEFVNC